MCKYICSFYTLRYVWRQIINSERVIARASRFFFFFFYAFCRDWLGLYVSTPPGKYFRTLRITSIREQNGDNMLWGRRGQMPVTSVILPLHHGNHRYCSRFIDIMKKKLYTSQTWCGLGLFRTLKFLRRKVFAFLHVLRGRCMRCGMWYGLMTRLIDAPSQLRLILRNHASSLRASCRVVGAVSRIKKDKEKTDISGEHREVRKADATTSAAKWNDAKQASRIPHARPRDRRFHSFEWRRIDSVCWTVIVS